MPFASLGLSSALVRAAGESGFTTPTPIQAQAIPAVLRGADVLGSAQTGSGKTGAFVLPMLQFLQDEARHTPRRVRALILVPTRELAAQVGEVVRGLAQHLPQATKVAVLFGGVSVNPQMMGLRGGADVVVAFKSAREYPNRDNNELPISKEGERAITEHCKRLPGIGKNAF